MKVLIICSKSFYDKIPLVSIKLKSKGHEVFYPNCYNNPESEALMWQKGEKAHQEFKKTMFMNSEKQIQEVDAVLVLNYSKNNSLNYIGGATFLEMYDAFRFNKKIYLINPIPKGILYDEIQGLNPIILKSLEDI